MDDRDEEIDRVALAEAMAKAREVIATICAELTPMLDDLVPVGRGDGEAHLPNSLRLIAVFFEAADARPLLEGRGDISERTIRRIAAGDESPRAASAVIDAVVRAVTALVASTGAPPSAIAELERQGTAALLSAAERWDALARVIGKNVRTDTAALIVLRFVAVDMGIRLAAMRPRVEPEHAFWPLRETAPIRYAIDQIVLPALGLELADVHADGSSANRRGDRSWPRSTLARWRLEGAIPEPGQLEKLAADLVAIARDNDKMIRWVDPIRVATRTLRVARTSAVLRRMLVDAFPDGIGERLASDFVSATMLVQQEASAVLAGDGLVIAYALTHMLSPVSEVALYDEDGATIELPPEVARAGITREQLVQLSRMCTMKRLMSGDQALRARIEAMTIQSVLALGAAAPEAAVIGARIAPQLPESGIRTVVERLGTEPRKAVLDQVAMVAFIEAIAERAPERRESLLAKAREVAAILPGQEERA